jgi:hypothetical protein
MKRILFLGVLTLLIFSGCNKHVENTPPPPPPPPPPPTTPAVKHLFANAGADTTICMPLGGSGNLFEAILNGRASHDDSGKIVSYSWAQLGDIDFLFPDNQQPNLSKDSTAVTFSFGYGRHQFSLLVKDDHGQVDKDTVTLNLISPFSYEYDKLSWDSTSGSLTTIPVKFEPGIIENWPDVDSAGEVTDVYLVNYTGACYDISNWQKLPYIPYDSIQQTDKKIFYTLIPGYPNLTTQGTMYPEIFAKTNSGIDFTQKVSVGFSIVSPWDY